MAAELIDGRKLAARLRERLTQQVRELATRGVRVKLAAILVGDDGGAVAYARSQQRNCENIGIEYELHRLGPDATQQTVLDEIARLNDDQHVHGVILLEPLPSGLDEFAAQCAISPRKDVEGVNPTNLGLLAMNRPALVPCTAAAAFELLKSSGTPLEGAEAVIIGRSNIVGKPIQMLLLAAHATVTQCHTRTRDVGFHTRRADILVVAAGRPGIVAGQDIKPGATVIDVGTNRIKTVDANGNETYKIVGDVDFETASQVAGKITPVPGGVGPVTVAMLLANTVEAAIRATTAAAG